MYPRYGQIQGTSDLPKTAVRKLAALLAGLGPQRRAVAPASGSDVRLGSTFGVGFVVL